MEIVRISTAGSVDDGKSTLIGRLLYDNNALTKEQEELVVKKTKEKGLSDLDLSVITDGLIAEREQGITIDVANIYFSTKTRKFIIADSPGHIEYTRNMVTGASNSNLSIILVDARKGLLEQSHRHFYISQLLELDNVIFCVNKMDLVAYSEDQFLSIAIEIKAMVASFNPNIEFSIVPISSLKGDNVVIASTKMDWYKGKTLNALLHESKDNRVKDVPFRYDVQQVYHVQNEKFVDYRGYAGRVISGIVNVGDKIVSIPSNKLSTVKEIRRYEDVLVSAEAGDSVTILLSDEIDISRGSLLVKEGEVPESKNVLSCTLVWMDDKPALLNSKYLLKSGSRQFPVKISEIDFTIDPIKLVELKDSESIKLNDICSVKLRLSQFAFLDSFKENRQNGIFILIDEQSNNTVALGIVK
ncbi:MAG: GTP-binding protein [Crocinitomicaceae bacterium]|jgi:sulfate adenylyltransferase subunit 1|nr:GTP-binding protein [Crocinitomicaceae bacterium]